MKLFDKEITINLTQVQHLLFFLCYFSAFSVRFLELLAILCLVFFPPRPGMVKANFSDTAYPFIHFCTLDKMLRYDVYHFFHSF